MSSFDSRQRLKRLLVEGLVIVLSILLAFSIDALWDMSQQRNAEKALLEALESDLINTRANLQRVANSGSIALEAIESFKSASPNEFSELQADSVVALLRGVFQLTTLEPVDGAFRSSNLSMIRNRQLRTDLALWRSEVEDIMEMEPHLHSNRERLEEAVPIGALDAFVSLLQGLEVDSNQIASLLAEMRSVQAVERSLIQKTLLLGSTFVKVERALVTTDRVIQSLERK